MTLEQAKRHLGHVFVQGCRQGSGFYPDENNEDLNQASRDVIDAMAETHGEIWLGRINNKHQPPLWKWDRGMVYNFAAAFVVPQYDAELERLIRERDEATYEGTTKDKERIDAIFERIEAIGGVHLHWS